MKKIIPLSAILFMQLCVFVMAEVTQKPILAIQAKDSINDSLQALLGISSIDITSTTIDLNSLYVPLDMPYKEHERIDAYRTEFMSNFGKRWLAEVIQTANVYRPHIRQQLAEYGLPQSLEFLPAIESDYDTNAVSTSGAMGIWQFMENSIAGLLEKNDWIDERRDPWRSTEAAAKKLLYNYNYFKNWELALAAYNMGVGGLNKAIKTAGNNDYWYLADNGYLSDQTKNYVPKFLAVADLITNSDHYGLDIDPYDSTATADFVEFTLTKQIDLEVLAQETGIDYKIYKFLNPALEYTITPPFPSYTVRIPNGSEAITAQSIEKQSINTVAYPYTVKKGDTLWSVSRKYGTTVENLSMINKRTPDEILSIGTVLFVPILK